MPRTRNTSKDEARQQTTFKAVRPKKQVQDLTQSISHVQFGRIGDDLKDLYHVFRDHVPGFTVETKDAILLNFVGDEAAYTTWEKFLLDCKAEAINQQPELVVEITNDTPPQQLQQEAPQQLQQEAPQQLQQEAPQQLQPEAPQQLQQEAPQQAENSMAGVLAKYGLNAIKNLTNATDTQVEQLIRVLQPVPSIRDIAGVCERILPKFYLSPPVLVDPMTVFTEERTQLFDAPYGVVGIKDKQIYTPLLAKSFPLSTATFDRADVRKKEINGLIMVRYLYKREPNITVNGSTKKICNFCKRMMPNLVDGTCHKCKCIYCGRSSRKEICDPCNFSVYLQTAVELDEPIRAKCGNLLFAYEADAKAVLLEERKVELERERQRVDAMAEIVAAAVKNGVSPEVARNVAQTMISADTKKNAKPIVGDDNESTEELEESEDEEKPKKRKRDMEQDRKRIQAYRKRKREEMGEEAYKAMINKKNREYKARKKQQYIEEARRQEALEERHP
jgi:hypothetical protein